MLFLDSDVLIDLTHGDEDALRFVKSMEAAGEDLATTSVNVAELMRGAEREPKRTEALGSAVLVLDSVAQVPFGPAAARRFGMAMASLDVTGKSIPTTDGMIAAVVLENGGRIATRNTRHFARVHGLEIVGPGPDPTR